MRIFFFACLLALTACQVYRNNSRNLFEQNAPGKIVNTNVGSHQVDPQGCWQQPKDLALSLINPESTYQVRLINDENIEVCLETTDSPAEFIE
jgi:hypothetical protein